MRSYSKFGFDGSIIIASSEIAGRYSSVVQNGYSPLKPSGHDFLSITRQLGGVPTKPAGQYGAGLGGVIGLHCGGTPVVPLGHFGGSGVFVIGLQFGGFP